MEKHSMPAELVELENRLRDRPTDLAAIQLRHRLMQAVAHELATPAQPMAQSNRSDTWSWAAIAAAVLIVMNLSRLSASQSEFSIWSKPSSNQISLEFQALRQLETQQEGALK